MLLPFFEWCEASFIGQAIRGSLWLFPVIEATHLVALALIGGALLILDFRMLGIGLRQPIPEVARDARPWLVGSLAVMIATGIALFLSESVKCYYNQAFWVKITTLPVALLFTFAVRQPIAKRATADATLRTKLVALISIGLWFTVAAAGRWIGFTG
jgi:uncharacterized protein DUF6644